MNAQFAGGHGDHQEGAAVAVEVVAAAHDAEKRGGGVEADRDSGPGKLPPMARDGFPDSELDADVPLVDDDPPVVAAERPPYGEIERRFRYGAGCVDVVDGAGRAAWIFEEAKHRRRPMELAAATEERGGGADEVRGLLRRDAEEDLFGGVVDELQQPAPRCDAGSRVCSG
ncbi:hypothetical protein PAHAL_8G126100 [Panicum hallii]|uniref:Uncharacterized protein n=1 Tax=Panicum hallii TaxID=206008 RepID=A0A2T8I8T9_9POAL|nr:hypothetical protein PAHAL_8G126100 [Panicum hallii]